MRVITIEDIARVCHEANRAYCISLGDYSQPYWDNAPEWQRQSAINGVEFHIKNPHASLFASHDNWSKEKLDTGWKYGPIKDVEKKTHPLLVPFYELSMEQQMKDLLFKSIVDMLKILLDYSK